MLFRSALLDQEEGDFQQALAKATEIAPYGAEVMARMRKQREILIEKTLSEKTGRPVKSKDILAA